MSHQNEENIDKTEENENIKAPEEECLLKEQTEDLTEVKQNGLAATEGENGKVKSVGENDEKNKDANAQLPFRPPLKRTETDVAVELRGSEETTCGIWCIKGGLLQKFANKKAYVLMYGVLGCVMSSTYAYLNGTITTLEKRYKIPTTNTGIIMVGCDISQLFFSVILNYYGGRGHRPRWIALGMYTVVLFCLMNVLPHFLYGPGQDALDLTEEYGSLLDNNSTSQLIDAQNRKSLCLRDGASECDDTSGNFAPQVILFMAHLISGVGGSLYFSLGVTYMDDNIKKSKTPALVSLSYFLRMLGPAMGYSLASYSLSLYISPSLTPTISTNDPRWLGAWWLGWLVLAAGLFVFGSLTALFPRALPRAAARRVLASERRREGEATDQDKPEEHELPTSFEDMKVTFKRLMKNKILMCNNFASVFYFMGYMPYWIFMPKYIETIYKHSASFASFITGAVGLVCSAIGILLSGMFISQFKPSARFLAAWNVVVGAISIMGIISYAYLGCPVNDRQGVQLASGQMETTTPCNRDCHCDYVRYSPVCSPDGRTFISPCHAGCNDYHTLANGSKVYKDCACAPAPPVVLALKASSASSNSSEDEPPADEPQQPWVLTEGPCPVDCTTHFYMFLVVLCVLKFSGATGRTSNLLVSVRCVDDKDKTVAMGLGLMLMSMFAFIPSPILFGYFIDTTCMVWGKTCSGTGNCWLYNAEKLRYLMNFTAAGFVSIGTMFDFGVWYYVKGLKIFDEEVDLELSPQRAKTQRK